MSDTLESRAREAAEGIVEGLYLLADPQHFVVEKFAAAMSALAASERERERQNTESTLMYLGFHSAVDALRRAWEKSPLKQESGT